MCCQPDCKPSWKFPLDSKENSASALRSFWLKVAPTLISNTYNLQFLSQRLSVVHVEVRRFLVLEIANRGSHGWEQRHLGVTKEMRGQK